MKKNKVFIATSIDGYISDKNGGLSWLEMIPNPNNIDMGYTDFMHSIDGIVMGRITFETVCGFDCDWPYTKPVFVLSHTLNSIPDEYKGKVEIVSGELYKVLDSIHSKGFHSLYIDGGKTIQNFLKEDMVDELIITTIPVLLGGGFPLFSEMGANCRFELVNSKIYLEQIVQSHYKRERGK